MRFPGFANACAQAAAEIVTSEIAKAIQTGTLDLDRVFRAVLTECESAIGDYAAKSEQHEQKENKP